MNINLTLIGQLIAFVAFVAFCMRYVWPPIAGAMAERQNRIADGLAAADRAGHDLEVAKQQADEQLADAKRGRRHYRGCQQTRTSPGRGSERRRQRLKLSGSKAAASAEIEQERARAQSSSCRRSAHWRSPVPRKFSTQKSTPTSMLICSNRWSRILVND